VLDLTEFKAEQERIKQGIKAAQDTIAKWSVELESITRSLDEALSLVQDPQALYDALPEGLKLLLTQTVFEKIWILDTGVVGSELTEPFTELLTLEARLALVEQREAGQAQEQQAATTGTDGAVTYYRRREAVSALLRDLGGSWERPYVERPHGPLPVDSQNPGPSRGRGSDVHHLVGAAPGGPSSGEPAWPPMRPGGGT